MEFIGLNDIREKYLRFFERKAHTRMPSFPLIPQGDSSLLLINSGMAPLKPFFTGEMLPPSKRVVTCQKCIRVIDIENVGKTSRHGTFFEMMGNFSFGDYFKREAITWAWEFVTKEMEIPVDKLYCSVYLDDDEAYDIWTKEIGVAESHMKRLGKEDNFWDIGAGPCGPCSEIYFDRGEKYSCGKADCAVGCECDRYVEFWNLVFTQFSNDGNGNYTELKQKNIDTGMGLERMACVMQGQTSIFEIDTMRSILERATALLGATYGADEKNDVSLRIITDHARAGVFLIADGVMPSNEGRGYVLRRLIRRAAMHGRLLKGKGEFLSKLCDTVIECSAGAYPDLGARREYIRKVMQAEERRFNETIEQGMGILNGMIDRLAAEHEKIMPGADVFRLYDTFGFPPDLTREMLESRGMDIDTEVFSELMQRQREQAREAQREALGDVGWTEDVLAEVAKQGETRFEGYDGGSVKGARVLAILRDGELADGAGEGDEAVLVLDKTPFYAESGGQVGDSGAIHAGDFKMDVRDCKKSKTGVFMHIGRVAQGAVAVGGLVDADIDMARRKSIMRNHSAAHLLQAALRAVLGEHVSQSGSYVDEARLRFDFTHTSALTGEELGRIEDIVNDMILGGGGVSSREMTLDEARAQGAIALFSEKYGDVVRVVSMEGHSVELCGGTHVGNVSEIGLFKILTESSVAAGIRRIEAATGANIIALIRGREAFMREISSMLKSNAGDAAEKVRAIIQENRELYRKVEELSAKLAQGGVGDMLAAAEDIGGLKFIVSHMKGSGGDALRKLGDALRDKDPGVVAVLAGDADGKAVFLAVCGGEAVARGIKAGDLVREVASAAGGKGGGRPDSAMAGGRDVSLIPAALDAAGPFVREKLKG